MITAMKVTLPVGVRTIHGGVTSGGAVSLCNVK